MRQEFRLGEWLVQPELNALSKNGTTVHLEPKVMEVLLKLAAVPARVVPREQLLQEIWPETFVTDDVLKRCISELRRALDDDAHEPRYIQTIAKKGYRLIGVVDSITSSSATLRASKSWMRPVQLLTLAATATIAAVLLWSGFRLNVRDVAAKPNFRVMALTALHGNERTPAISPDGANFAFSWDQFKAGEYDIYIAPLERGAEPTRITDNPAIEWWPVWSPDSRRVAFLRAYPKEVAVVIKPVMGGAEREVFRTRFIPPWDTYLHWSPDGDSIAVTIAAQPNGGFPVAIYLLSLKNGSLRKLSNPPPDYSEDSMPRFSHDGSRVAFWRRKTPTDQDVYTVDVATGQERRLTFDDISGTSSPRRPALDWSADGRSIIYTRFIKGSPTLRSVPADGGESRLFASSINAVDLTISPLGKRLVYTQPGRDSDVWRFEIPATGIAQRHEKLIASSSDDGNAQYSPDGSKVVYVSARSGAFELWVTDAEGKDHFQLTSLQAISGSPMWSPDGQYIAFDVRMGPPSDIYVVPANGGEVRQITHDPADDFVPSWSRDGQWIYFTSTRAGKREVWKVPSQGGKELQVTQHGGFFAQESFDGKQLYYAKSETPGLWKQPAGGGQEVEVIHGLLGCWGFWSLTRDGVAFLNNDAKPFGAFEHLDFTSGKRRTLFRPLEPIFCPEPSLSISPDGRWAIYHRMTRRDNEIMLAEGIE